MSRDCWIVILQKKGKLPFLNWGRERRFQKLLSGIPRMEPHLFSKRVNNSNGMKNIKVRIFRPFL